MRADQVLPDHVNEAAFNGLVVRKGTVAAFIASAKVYLDDTVDAETRSAAERDIVDSVPALRALGLLDVMAVRDARLSTLIAQTESAQAEAQRGLR